MNLNKLTKLREPRLKFGYGQMAEDPRDGLTLFGPFDRGQLNNFNVGVIGTEQGIAICKKWLTKLSKPTFHPSPDIANPFFPGFEETFQIALNTAITKEIKLDTSTFEIIYRYYDNHVRVSELVNMYLEPLENYINTSERLPDVWIIIIPDQVYTVGRPNSSVPKKGSISVGIKDQYTRHTEGMFETDEIRKWREAYKYENHFHNQLKIRLLKHKVLTQIIRESTIGYEDISKLPAWKLDGIKTQDTAKAWNLATALYYKLGGLPWKLGDKSKRTKTITAEKDDQKKAFMLFATPLLKGMALKPALTNDDRGALNLPERDAPTDRVKITTAPLAKIIPMEGGELSIRVRTTSDNNRASRHPDADHVEMRYALVDATAASSGSSGGSGSNPSTGSGNQNSIPTKAMDCIFTESSKKAVFTVELGQENSGKRIYAFFRWVNTSKRSDSGPWSTAVQSVVV